MNQINVLNSEKSHNIYFSKSAAKSACCASAKRADNPANLMDLHRLRGQFWQKLQTMQADPHHYPHDHPFWDRFREVRDRLLELDQQIIHARVSS